jgi:hypothetical protein
MLDIEQALNSLFSEKRIFCAEADFQFALAWKIQELYPDSVVRLEYIPWRFDRAMHLDIAVFLNGEMFPIELKYKTRLFEGMIDGEPVFLKNQAAQDIGRYDFIYDIHRLEAVAMSGEYPIKEAYAILLTNDSGYWNKSLKSGTQSPPVDDEFRIHEGAVISEKRGWKPEASPSTRLGREDDIILLGCYPVHWHDYIPMEACPFRYTIIQVQTNNIERQQNPPCRSRDIPPC